MALRTFQLERVEDIDRIPFEDGLAAIDVPVELFDRLPIRDHERGESARLRALEARIAAEGYRPLRPVIVRVGRKGRWVVVDGGHRLTALLHLRRRFWTRLFGRLRGRVYLVLFLTPDSWCDVGVPEGVVLPDASPEDRLGVQSGWERSRIRGQGGDTI